MKNNRNQEPGLNARIPFVAAGIMLEQLALINKAIEKAAEDDHELKRILLLFKAASDQFSLAFDEYYKILHDDDDDTQIRPLKGGQ
jgi:hypothetical protein